MLNREDLLSGTRPEVGSRILITVENHFQGYEIIDYRGMVWGVSMRSKDMVQDIIMGCKEFTGGELSSYTELADEGRQRAIDRMLSMAKRIKANAIINFKFEQNLSSYYHNNTEVTAFGNAVVIRPIKNYVPTGGLGNILSEFYDAYVKISTGQELKEEPQIIKTPEGKLIKNGDKIGVKCPNCGMLYNAVVTPQKTLQIKCLSDVDESEPGQQIICSNCNQKFTVPFSEQTDNQ